MQISPSARNDARGRKIMVRVKIITQRRHLEPAFLGEGSIKRGYEIYLFQTPVN